ncbi:Hsp20/alpha crystallin family protein [Mycobacterium lentiflavum]|uniref:Hsp20/alpha crystallin family protein n=1 Tax=Mycobacterium lentiflavum TaxID=141349 RepID=UPI001C30B184|nr:Hsp20 family protein [Mycobacterium lentiflavum]
MPTEALWRGDQLIVSIDGPGADPNVIDVTVERNVVEITAHRQPIREQEGDEAIVGGRPLGEFRRQLFLGENLDSDNVSGASDHRSKSTSIGLRRLPSASPFVRCRRLLLINHGQVVARQ